MGKLLRLAHPEPRREVINTRSATGGLMLILFAGFAQFEREIMLERQREGIRKAQAAGNYLGRKPSASPKAVALVSRP
jgi:DNA invertase Pin-like site-specific DNA recombinase